MRMDETTHNLGLANKSKEKYSKKTVEDVYKELDSISNEECFNIICDFFKKLHLPANMLSWNPKHKYIEASIATAGSWQGGPLCIQKIAIQVVEERPTHQFIAIVPYFMLFGKKTSRSNYCRLYLDFAFPELDILTTYSWNETYQNYSSFPYEISRHNLSKVLKDLEDWFNLRDEFKRRVEVAAKFASLEDNDIEKIVKDVYKDFITDDLWAFAKEHGGLVSENESHVLASSVVTPIEILREARRLKSYTISLNESLEEAIYNTTGLSLEVRGDLNEETNRITISDGTGKVRRVLDLPTRFSDRQMLENTVEEAVSKEAARLIGKKPSCNGFYDNVLSRIKLDYLD